ncbi:MAG: hypothetical protein Cons2KO_02220 [Congregibacter sp.]
MKPPTFDKPASWPILPWSTSALVGVALPVLLILLLSDSPPSLTLAIAPILTLSLMGVGIIVAATTGFFAVGISLALLSAAGLLVLAVALGLPTFSHPVYIGSAMLVASASFTARGALFAKTLSYRGWLMALFVVAGEASVLLIVAVFPGVLPGWFLALLPAQWGSIAIQAAMTDPGPSAAASALIALAGTALTTLLAARFWLHPWPYPLMFTVWLGLSAVVYFDAASAFLR